LYDDTARQHGYEGGSAYRGALLQVRVDETEEKAMKNAQQFMWMQGEFTGLTHPVWAAPSGYLGEWARKPMAELRAGYRSKQRKLSDDRSTFQARIDNGTLIAGTPKQVIEKLRIRLEETRCSILSLWGNDGNIDHKDSRSFIRLMGQEVLPALREIAKSLDLGDPFDIPVSRKFANAKWEIPQERALSA
jgi:alkanesulfonate monooxygenase SsuD/methylene tetrahydromethanopterin reductase-like flavin-dependent oxidoreductase (luciferase family)